MLTKCKAEVTIKQVDNGYILEWEQEKPKRNSSRFRDPDEDDGFFGPRGVEIIETQAALLKRLKELL